MDIAPDKGMGLGCGWHPQLDEADPRI